MNKEIRMINTECYTYLNLNPKGKFDGDCVIRAIALATNQAWEQTVRDLTELGIKKGLVCNDKKLYPLYLKEKRFIECKEPRDCFNYKMSVKDWLKGEKLDDIIIVANVGSHHITCIKNGSVHDIWNCSTQTMHKYWYKKVC